MSRTLIAGDDTGLIVVEGDSLAPPSDTGRPDRVIDAAGLYVAPGFVDLQINGGFGIDLASTPDKIWDLGRLLPRLGVTAFLPTIISSPQRATDAALDAIGKRPANYVGAEPVGLHLEGPMLNPLRAGAHPVEHLAEPSDKIIERWSKASGVTMVTLAPELPGAIRIIAELRRRGVIVAAGHSNATAAEARQGLDAGVTTVTHLYNAMAPFNHRAPGLMGATLADPALTAGLIVDGVHVDPVAVAAAWNAKGPAAITLVTDAVAPMGLSPGEYILGSTAVQAHERSVRGANGQLAGSLLTMDQAVRNIIDYTGCTLAEAVVAASTTPADVIGETRRGRLEPGALADIVLLDHNLQVAITMCAGQIVYVAPSALDRLDPDQRPE